MSFILAAVYASPERRLVIGLLCGAYLAGVGGWAGSRLAAVWQRRKHHIDHWG